METNELIDSLVKDHKKTKALLTQGQFFTLYLLMSFSLFALAIIFLPIRSNLSDQLNQFHYYIETGLWMLLSVVGGFGAYRLLSPGVSKKSANRSSWLVLLMTILLTIVILSRLPYESLASEFAREMNYKRGWCGPIIIILGMMAYGLLHRFLKRGYILEKYKYSLLLATALGCIGSLSMQYICAHETSAHILTWHYPPFLILAACIGALSSKFSKK